MKKYPGIILAMTTAVMITSCSSVFNGGNTKSTGEHAASESGTTEAQTDMIKIENETDPEPSSEPETSPEAEPERSRRLGRGCKRRGRQTGRKAAAPGEEMLPE